MPTLVLVLFMSIMNMFPAQLPPQASHAGSPPTIVCLEACHQVRQGETLWSIAQLYGGQKWEELYIHNNLKSTNLAIGQILYIPASWPVVYIWINNDVFSPAMKSLDPEASPIIIAPTGALFSIDTVGTYGFESDNWTLTFPDSDCVAPLFSGLQICEGKIRSSSLTATFLAHSSANDSVYDFPSVIPHSNDIPTINKYEGSDGFYHFMNVFYDARSQRVFSWVWYVSHHNGEFKLRPDIVRILQLKPQTSFAGKGPLCDAEQWGYDSAWRVLERC